MSWPNGDPVRDPAYPSEHVDCEAWQRGTCPELAAQEPSLDLSVTLEIEDAAEKAVAAGEPVERFRATCEFGAAALYQSLPATARQGFWEEAREKGHARVLEWPARQELEIRARRAARGGNARRAITAPSPRHARHLN